ncbi:unnamed protein product [Darwinula stevensoni]|uniref:Peptidase S1 domain-containing protein n=1 Tax=Darwinula stevensoni TaxID=69355 RepID=A0A7R9AH03_9CRUS|nr:unnamed protein product [Darwinula stevensoni]CAG0904232.1 unnamed protein product [Darwinula stevensoni]
MWSVDRIAAGGSECSAQELESRAACCATRCKDRSTQLPKDGEGRELHPRIEQRKQTPHFDCTLVDLSEEGGDDFERFVDRLPGFESKRKSSQTFLIVWTTMKEEKDGERQSRHVPIPRVPARGEATLSSSAGKKSRIFEENPRPRKRKSRPTNTFQGFPLSPSPPPPPLPDTLPPGLNRMIPDTSERRTFAMNGYLLAVALLLALPEEGLLGFGSKSSGTCSQYTTTGPLLRFAFKSLSAGSFIGIGHKFQFNRYRRLTKACRHAVASTCGRSSSARGSTRSSWFQRLLDLFRPRRREPAAARQNPVIIGGTPATIAEAPWLVYVSTVKSNGTFGCTGSIIDQYHVLTAGHCIVDG